MNIMISSISSQAFSKNDRTLGIYAAHSDRIQDGSSLSFCIFIVTFVFKTDCLCGDWLVFHW